MGSELEQFVRYSVRYQILLARHVANICNANIYIFDGNGFFDHKSETIVELIDGVRTVSKEGYRAVLSVAVKESFGADQELFLKFVDENVAQKDPIGLFVSPVQTNQEVKPLEEEGEVKPLEEEGEVKPPLEEEGEVKPLEEEGEVKPLEEEGEVKPPLEEEGEVKPLEEEGEVKPLEEEGEVKPLEEEGEVKPLEEEGEVKPLEEEGEVKPLEEEGEINGSKQTQTELREITEVMEKLGAIL